MKKNYKAVLMAVAVATGGVVGGITATLSTPIDAHAQQTTSKTVNVSYLNVRAGADKNSAIIGVIKKGDVLAITDVVKGWNKFTYNGQTAYVDGNFLTTGTSTSTSTTTSSTASTSLTGSYTTGVKTVNVSYLNVRSSTDKSSAILGVLKQGDVITVDAMVRGWSQITYNGKTGYVYGLYLLDGANAVTTATAPTTTNTYTEQTTEQTTQQTTQPTNNNASTSGLKNPKTPATTDKIYNVSSGETLFTIAVNYYGDASYGKYIVEYNKEVVSSNGSSVKAGMELYLPEYLNGQKRFADLNSDSNGYVYTFKSSDTLYSLAKAQYGHGDYCTVIYEANKDRLKSVSLVYTGQKIYIPYSIN